VSYFNFNAAFDVAYRNIFVLAYALKKIQNERCETLLHKDLLNNKNLKRGLHFLKTGQYRSRLILRNNLFYQCHINVYQT